MGSLLWYSIVPSFACPARRFTPQSLLGGPLPRPSRGSLQIWAFAKIARAFGPAPGLEFVSLSRDNRTKPEADHTLG